MDDITFGRSGSYGIAMPAQSLMSMNALSVLWSVLVIVDVSHIWHQSRLDPEILKLLQLHANTPSILVLNKVPQSVSHCSAGLRLCSFRFATYHVGWTSVIKASDPCGHCNLV